ncbi:hypothetical protein NX794_19130 [Streptomyces sp. LP11]|uniref:MHYT domain-containing protein n=1 Tax=Streptomyces pyxinicus TaxID=2970331 RepID=A0ABT2B469_9ACTN|nr:MHYT domain-containing protein [Streptomyces sp. LP11]MCS0603311.1 hypothetical protein [Streptomyces sp. LP11]
MRGTVDGFGYGAATPLVACVMACLGSALGLRCIARSRLAGPARRPVWLALGAAAIGSCTWTTHFVAMTGFGIQETRIDYDGPMTGASLAVAVVMAGVGVFIVGYRGATGTALVTGGTVTGLGIASMHYLGMAGMHFHGRFAYNTLVVTASVAIAVVAATAALWAAARARGFRGNLGASLVMALAVSGMHYTGMAALSVRLDGPAHAAGGPEASVLAPMLIGPLAFLLLLAVAVIFDPLMITGRPAAAPARPEAGVPAVAPSTGRRPVPRRRRAPAGRPERHSSRTW